MTTDSDSLADKCNQEVLLNFDGFFIIKKFDGWNIWMENSHGEGTAIKKTEFLAALAQLFERNFK